MSDAMQIDGAGAANRSQTADSDTTAPEEYNNSEYMERLRDVLQCQVMFLSTIPALEELQGRYQQSLASGKSLAVAFSNKPQAFHEETLNSMISAEVGKTGPRLIASDGDKVDPPMFIPNWVDALREKQAGAVVTRGDGRYCGRFRGQDIEWDEKEDATLEVLMDIRLPYGADIPLKEKTLSDALAFANQIKRYFAQGAQISAKGLEITQSIIDDLENDKTSFLGKAGGSSKSEEALPLQAEDIGLGKNPAKDDVPDKLTNCVAAGGEKAESVRSDETSANSILQDDRGDIEYARDHSHEPKGSRDHVKERGISTPQTFIASARESEMMARSNSPKAIVASQPNTPQTIPATTNSHPNSIQTRQTQSPKQVTPLKQRARRTNLEMAHSSVGFLEDGLARGLSFEAIQPLYNERFKVARDVEELQKIYNRHSSKKGGGLNKRTAPVAESGPSEPFKRICPAASAPPTSIKTTWSSVNLSGFVPLAPMPSELRKDAQNPGV